MAQQVMIAGAVFDNVPSIKVPDSQNVFHSFVDSSDATATAADIASGKTAYVNGSKVTGTASGGGGLVYETGTYEPTADTNSLTISYTNAHTERPFYVCIYDTTGDLASANSGLSWDVVCFFDLYGAIPVATTGNMFALVQQVYKTASSANFGRTAVTNETALNGILTNSMFSPNASPNYFRANRTYKWIAVWKPTV